MLLLLERTCPVFALALAALAAVHGLRRHEAQADPESLLPHAAHDLPVALPAAAAVAALLALAALRSLAARESRARELLHALWLRAASWPLVASGRLAGDGVGPAPLRPLKLGLRKAGAEQNGAKAADAAAAAREEGPLVAAAAALFVLAAAAVACLPGARAVAPAAAVGLAAFYGLPSASGWLLALALAAAQLLAATWGSRGLAFLQDAAAGGSSSGGTGLQAAGLLLAMACHAWRAERERDRAWLLHVLRLRSLRAQEAQLDGVLALLLPASVIPMLKASPIFVFRLGFSTLSRSYILRGFCVVTPRERYPLESSTCRA